MGCLGVCLGVFNGSSVDPTSCHCAHRYVFCCVQDDPRAKRLPAVQHLVLSTQRLTSDHPSSTEGHLRSNNQSGPVRFYSEDNTQDVELQSAVFVVTDTSSEPAKDDRKTHYSRADQKTHLHNEDASIVDGKGRVPGVSFGP